ncbi:MAG TPA: pyridoxamine 5'-phosphate oxidase family protein [Dehalococcoidia bacterium]|nr:pyridoxamine 5'-phosphate oxidase family protein [Dehalococcoidia bacterium]
MPQMSPSDLTSYLQQPLVTILTLSRAGRGPIAAPVWYDYDGRVFRLSTSPSSMHGRLIAEHGRATLTMHSERYDGATTDERYATIEGSIAFTDEPLEPFIRQLLLRYRGADMLETALEELMPEVQAVGQRVALLTPVTMSGHAFP